MNNLEPRAKIGDVVILNKQESAFKVHEFFPADDKFNWVSYRGYAVDKGTVGYIKHSHFLEEDILKNLTTNVSYEESDD